MTDKKRMCLIFDSSVLVNYFENKKDEGNIKMNELFNLLLTVPRSEIIAETPLSAFLNAIIKAKSIDTYNLKQVLDCLDVHMVHRETKEVILVSKAEKRPAEIYTGG